MDLKEIIKSLVTSEDRRKYPRVLLDLPLEYRTQYNPRIRGAIVIDASEIGFLIHSIENMLVGMQLKIVVLYPSEYSLENLKVLAKIVWKKIDKREKRYLYGLKFNGILAEDDCKLRELLRSNSEPPLPISIRPNVEKKRVDRF
jgi:hypothetical protein